MSDKTIETLKAALKWWENDAQYLTTGEYNDMNVFDDDPDWVLEARKLLESDDEIELPHREDYSERSYTHIDDVLTPGWQCNDCGAYADTKEQIKHHESCKPGESEYWTEFYSRQEEVEDS